jgi:hypothetical protein
VYYVVDEGDNEGVCDDMLGYGKIITKPVLRYSSSSLALAASSASNSLIRSSVMSVYNSYSWSPANSA